MMAMDKSPEEWSFRARFHRRASPELSRPKRTEQRCFRARFHRRASPELSRPKRTEQRSKHHLFLFFRSIVGGMGIGDQEL
ncbi:uncharacterized protein A4U43_C06F15320 [Asparagus officinalis]|uniref:Uncharacterized protein n=1 Tax=Asparagus officinalis TaxID=4686 RepID=A0A5P1EPK4_ASPOF|nr:uncharacterized protein A4U43_C06F15320 [Asparagus officinalis]